MALAIHVAGSVEDFADLMNEKAAELGLIDGYCLGALTDRQARAWLRETAETMQGGSAR